MAYLSAGWQSTAGFILNWGWALGREGPGHLSCPSCITRLETPFPSSLAPGLSGPLISQRLTELPAFPSVPHSQGLTKLTRLLSKARDKR